MSFPPLEELFSDLSEQQLSRLKIYEGEILRFNKAINIMSKATTPRLLRNHLADSILGIKTLGHSLEASKPIYDFGSGNGLPGIVMSVLRSDMDIYLIERDKRKCEFLRHVSSLMGLSRLRVLNREVKRLEEGSVNQALCRAFASLPRALLDYQKLFPKGGKFIHFKSSHWKKEIEKLSPELKGAWSISSLGEYRLPDSEITNVIVISQRLGEEKNDL